MQPSHIISATLIITVGMLPGCMTPGTEMHHGAGGKSFVLSEMPSADPTLDHVFAWIPRDRAKTASVAKAVVHVELGRAKEETGKTLCGGDWLINGASVDSIGPHPSTAPSMLGAYPAWYYHISHEPGLAGCSAVPPERLYRELGNRLPPWIILRAASAQAGDHSITAITATLPQY
jgi:hypothetical protein